MSSAPDVATHSLAASSSHTSPQPLSSLSDAAGAEVPVPKPLVGARQMKTHNQNLLNSCPTFGLAAVVGTGLISFSQRDMCPSDPETFCVRSASPSPSLVDVSTLSFEALLAHLMPHFEDQPSVSAVVSCSLESSTPVQSVRLCGDAGTTVPIPWSHSHSLCLTRPPSPRPRRLRLPSFTIRGCFDLCVCFS